MEFDDYEPIAHLSEAEEDATGFISPILIAELTRDRIYAKFNQEYHDFQLSRMPDNERLPREPADGPRTDAAFRLKKEKQVLDHMVEQLLEHQISLPSVLPNN
jgi:hypothetical protein